jgi:outer membrane protein OmpA-like peptidoglycan-associated protein
MNRTCLATTFVLGSVIGAAAYAQSPAPNPAQQVTIIEPQPGEVPLYRVTVVARTTPAINYRHRGGATKIDFEGTQLLPRAHGEAKVESKQGYIEIEVEFDELEPATKFGPEYLTYVLWAITPEGRATNLGEVLLNGTESKLNVTTELQMFGLVMTAEPYFAVSQPSDVVVMENRVRGETRGKFEAVEAKYELLKRGTYVMTSGARTVGAFERDEKAPLELDEARNAVRLSRAAGADRYAGDTFDRASALLQQAEESQERRRGRKSVVMVAREAVQRAEDARLIALQRQNDEQIAMAREAAARREADARAEARMEADRRLRAEEARLAAERDRLASDEAAARSRREAEEISGRLSRERAEADAARVAAERARAEAETAVQRLNEERAAAQADAERARQLAAAAESEKNELREKLQKQLSLILETKETARGLIVSMPDVLFDFNQSTLRAGAREKLAKVAGVLLAYPDLQVEVEGHTDNVGTDDYNQRLSERRAESVRGYLTQQGIPAASIAARGFGESRPVVSNDADAGRQQNRRVELVVSGAIIGVTDSSTSRQ